MILLPNFEMKFWTSFQALQEEREERKKQEALLAAEREKDDKQREAEEQARVWHIAFRLNWYLMIIRILISSDWLSSNLIVP